MSKTNSLLALFLIFSFTACEVDKNKKSTNSDESTKFLKALLKEELEKYDIVIVLNPTFCGACNDDTINFLGSLVLSNHPTALLLSSRDKEIESKIVNLGIQGIYFPEYVLLEKYGMVGPYSQFILLDNGKVIFRENIDQEKYETIKNTLISFNNDN